LKKKNQEKDERWSFFFTTRMGRNHKNLQYSHFHLLFFYFYCEAKIPIEIKKGGGGGSVVGFSKYCSHNHLFSTLKSRIEKQSFFFFLITIGAVYLCITILDLKI